MAPETRQETPNGLEQQFQVWRGIEGMCAGRVAQHCNMRLRKNEKCIIHDQCNQRMLSCPEQVNFLAHWLLARELLLAPSRRSIGKAR